MSFAILRQRALSNALGAVAGLAMVVAARPVAAQNSARALAGPPVSAASNSRPDTTLLPVMLVEEDVVTFIDQPTASLIAARDAMERRDAQTAARDVAAGAAFLRIHAGGAAGADRAELVESSRDLDALALDIRQRRVRSVAQFDRSVRHIDRVVARHHWERATRAWASRETAKAGAELRAAADAADRAAHAGGRDTEAAARDVVKGARLVSGKLIDGAGWTVDEVGKGITGLGSFIERLGRDVEPRRR